MTQKVLAGRANDQKLGGDLVEVKVDQVILAREPNRVLGQAVGEGLKLTQVETAIAYGTRCITTNDSGSIAHTASAEASREALDLGVLVARPGIGFAPAVHLERFASPARLAITDEPRMASVGGIGLLSLPASPAQLASSLKTGKILVRPPRSIQVLLSGKVRPFVCMRDVTLELIRQGLKEEVARIDQQYQAPVVIEFAGPSARLLSVPDRAVLCSIAPQLGAAAALFIADEKTEVFLRDQRRSKAHRSLSPDAGAPCDHVITLDLGGVDPLAMTADGQVHGVRELGDQPVKQVILGGDSGSSLRDILATAALLKSKRIPAKLDFLLAPPSRQSLEVLARSGALVDLIATGARLLEPDARILSGELYPPNAGGLSLRTFDPEPGRVEHDGIVVVSAETLAYAVATGKLGDPRSFKRPVRVTVPRTLPTDDVLLVRRSRGQKASKKEASGSFDVPHPPDAWSGAEKLPLIAERARPEAPSAVLASSLEDVRWAARQAAVFPEIRAVIASHIPAGTVSVLAGLGVLALKIERTEMATLSAESSLALPAPDKWRNGGIDAKAGGATFHLEWLAVGAERRWTEVGGAGAAIAESPSRK